ncbi:CHAP domain-containing protein [Acrocarpospora catenulata]|uniref:CHAP domain-containing protein n=1 Tax=Acrocarpospora catenulata TaxID=2836182 RepID=UPI0027E03786|nr:CHAP domain-containing protein [Acrocarpospora catenulata]
MLERSPGDTITEDLLAVVTGELGYREKPGQHTKFGAWYAETVKDPQYRNAPWCDMFIAWAADRAGVTDYVGAFAWTPSHARWFEQHNAWTDTPEPGALVFFDWAGGDDIKGIDHVGIVEKVENGKLHTIEANVDRVWLKRKVRDESKVVGYGVPRLVRDTLNASPDTLNLRPDAVTAVAGGASGVSPGAAVATGVLALALGASLIATGLHVRRLARAAKATGRHRRKRAKQSVDVDAVDRQAHRGDVLEGAGVGVTDRRLG